MFMVAREACVSQTSGEKKRTRERETYYLLTKKLRKSKREGVSFCRRNGRVKENCVRIKRKSALDHEAGTKGGGGREKRKKSGVGSAIETFAGISARPRIEIS